MKHEFPKWDEDNRVWIKGPTSNPKRGPKRPKGRPATQCHYCDAFFCSRKQKGKHIQLSHRRRLFTADGLPVDEAI